MHREKLNDLDQLPVTRTGKAVVLIYFIIMHIGAIASLLFFTWEGLALAVGLYFVTGFGITIGYHRLLTHNSFKTYPIVRAMFAFAGALAMQSDPILWPAYHRKHHQHSDSKGDPHSPLDGFSWAHFWWLIPAFSVPYHLRQDFENHYAPDLVGERMIRAIRNYYPLILVIFIALVMLSGWCYGGLSMMWSFLFWGVFLREIVLKHVTWSVNSAAHTWGYRNYPTNDRSFNNPVVGILAMGEGWHNNHHGTPVAANHGQKWWEIDVSYYVIVLMRWLHLAWDVHTVPSPH